MEIKPSVSSVVVKRASGSKWNRFLQWLGLRDKETTIHVVWTEKDDKYPNSYNIKYSKSDDGGKTYKTPTIINR